MRLRLKLRNLLKKVDQNFPLLLSFIEMKIFERSEKIHHNSALCTLHFALKKRQSVNRTAVFLHI